MNGIDSAWGIAEQTHHHSTVSRTRRLDALEENKAVVRSIAHGLGAKCLLDGRAAVIDGWTLEVNFEVRSLQRMVDGRKYDEYLKGLAQSEGIESPIREQLMSSDRERKEKGSNRDWRGLDELE